tara:strand:+ start:1440 stop:1784 length:345 start_codon:yes stop_codon:yes gene_type:complete
MANKYNKMAIRRHLGKGKLDRKTVPKGCKWYAWAKNTDFTNSKAKAVDVACASTGMQANCMKNAFAKSNSHSYANYNFKPKGIPTALAKKGLNIKVWNPRSNYLLGKCSSKKKY